MDGRVRLRGLDEGEKLAAGDGGDGEEFGWKRGYARGLGEGERHRGRASGIDIPDTGGYWVGPSKLWTDSSKPIG